MRRQRGQRACARSHAYTLFAQACAALTLAAVNPIYEALKGPADYFSSLGLPEPLIHWGE